MKESAQGTLREGANMIVQLVVASGSRVGHKIPIAVEKFIIGRAADCHLISKSELISRYHCAILVGDEVFIRDLGSRNGVRHNGEKVVAEQKLRDGDHLVMGPLEFNVQITGQDGVPMGTDGVAGYNFPGDGEHVNVGPQDATVILNSTSLTPDA